MTRVLIVARAAPDRPPLAVARALIAADYDIAPVALDSADELSAAFRGRPTSLVLADLSGGEELFLLRRARALTEAVWGRDFPALPTVGLIVRRHLALPELRLFLDEFALPPYDPEEVRARVALTLFRRRHLEPGDSLAIGGIRLSLSAGKAYAPDGQPLPLTPREYELLRFLAENRGRSFTREQLLLWVWGSSYEGGERTVDIHIRRLRAKLPAATAGRLETQRGTGYRLLVETI